MQYSTRAGEREGILALHRTPSGLSQGIGRQPASASFVGELRSALRHLYDPVALRHSPLLALFGLEQEQDAVLSLRRLLLAGIEALKPGPDTPPHANAWRLYRILYERYAEQFSQEEVAIHLAVGSRQLRRQESRALRVLADHLWAECDPQRLSAPTSLAASVATPSREQELAWLRSYPNEPVAVTELIPPVLRVVAPLLEALGTAVDCSLPDSLPRPVVQLTAARQALSNVITAAVRAAPQGRVSVACQAAGPDLVIRVQAHPRGASVPLAADDLENLEMARQMIGFSGGRLETSLETDKRRPFSAQLVLRALSEVSVLVIDDNADTLQLLERYLAGTRYRFTGTSDPGRALGLAAETAPQIIVLDVMLPGLDGWELLGRLREHPRTRGVPVIVCTILAQEQLALALGAAAFIRKPVSRETLLAALEAQLKENWSANPRRPGAGLPIAPRPG